MTYNPGDVVTVGGTFDSDATAQLESATVAALNTGLFALQVLTPGGGYTTPDGVVFLTSFDTAAPEPATFALCALGCLGLLLASFRKLRSAAGTNATRP